MTRRAAVTTIYTLGLDTLDLGDYLSINAAAKLKKVSREALRLAIERGQVRATPAHARLTLVHKDELAKYTPEPNRQRAGRASARARAKGKRKRRAR